MTLLVRPSKGYLTHNTNLFTSMDPYCYVYLGKQAQRTNTHYGGGIKPSWSDILKFKVQNITKLGIEIWAKALIGNDTLVGQGLIDIRKLNLAKGDTIQQYVDIFIQNKSAGRVLLQMKFAHAQNIHKESPTNQEVQKAIINQKWDTQRKPQRHSWAGDVKWRQSNASENIFQPSQSAVYDKEQKQQNTLVSPKFDNPNNFSDAVLNGGFNKKKPTTLDGQRVKTEQDKATEYLNRQMINNFIPQPQNGNPHLQPPFEQHQNYQQQQMFMYQQQLQQQKLIQQQKFQQQGHNQLNRNNAKHPGLTVGTVIAQPNRNLNSNMNKQSNNNQIFGIGTTPPKSILNPSGKSKSKSLGKKKVKFDDAR